MVTEYAETLITAMQQTVQYHDSKHTEVEATDTNTVKQKLHPTHLGAPSMNFKTSIKTGNC